MILIRPCQGFDEFEACVQLQVETWGYDVADIIPRRAFKIAQSIGGQVIAAFDTAIPGTPANGNPGSIVAFALSLPGVKNIQCAPFPYLHSHMLAVRESWRNRGLGAQLKLAQRVDALERGIRLMQWTFDPLEIKNSYLNIHKLGAIVCAYEVNFYGVSSSRLQGGLPTDRLVAQWHLDSPRVLAALEGRQAIQYKIEERIHVPASIYAWKASESERHQAQSVQLANRARFQEAFSQGLSVVGFRRDEQGNGVFELGRLPQSELRTEIKENQ